MKFLHLIVRNAMRNKVRTLLTLGGSAFLMFVLVFMMTALTEMEAWQGEAATHNRVAVQHSTGLANPLPYALETYLRSDEISRHAKYCIKLNWFGGYYQEPKNFFANFATDHQWIREIFDEFRIPDDHYKAFCDKKDSCIIGKSLADKYKLKVGQRMTLISTLYPINPEFEIVGIFTTKDIRQEEQLFFQWNYFNELLKDRKIVSTYWLKANSGDDIAILKQKIDDHTKNSSDPTETMTEKEFGQQFMAMMGNVKGLVMNIGSVILIIMILMTANTIAMSARERVTEIAVMRTLGFSSGTILFLILAESVFVNLLGTAISLGISVLAFNIGHLSPAPTYFPYFLVEPTTMIIAVSAAVIGGLASAAVPAIRASRRSIVDGLRQVV